MDTVLDIVDVIDGRRQTPTEDANNGGGHQTSDIEPVDMAAVGGQRETLKGHVTFSSDKLDDSEKEACAENCSVSGPISADDGSDRPQKSAERPCDECPVNNGLLGIARDTIRRSCVSINEQVTIT